MAKEPKVAYVCQECGADYSRWVGQCSVCKEWNTITEVRLTPKVSGARNVNARNRQGYAGSLSAKTHKLGEIELTSEARISSGFLELDRVLGGGLVRGSAILIGGHPGAGKSTLLIQVLAKLSQQQHQCLYVTGEESLQQVAMRADRLKLKADELNLVGETSVEQICNICDELKPKIVVIDSIQVMHLADITSSPGSVSQVRECAAFLTAYAKQNGCIMILVGHVTKDGTLAGPKVLEHCIDCSILIEGESDSRYRTLRSYKNRFGAVNELGVFAMTEEGLKEVKNPSAIFLNRTEQTSGSAVTVLWEGTRPLLVEIQALVDSSNFANPRRVVVGLEQNRLALITAVLHRHTGMALHSQDIFVNAVGGVKASQTAVDLALLFALISSFKNIILPQDLMIFGEIGLGGEIRPVPSGQERIIEAAKHGFTKAIVPFANQPKNKPKNMQIFAVKNIRQAIDVLEQL